jgi:Formate hydrogenlyase subunit 3/Multisubunit Na+/H+ antiporter, MnhD subunit
MIGQTTLLASAFVVPLGMLLLCLWPQVLNRMPSLLAFAPFPALAAVLLVATDSSLAIGSARFHLTFAMDRPGAMLLGVSALLWIAAGAYASQYLQSRPNHGRFVACWLMALTGCIGVFLAADMVGFYFLLALLTLGACGLVIYHETPSAWRAGAVYIGLALLAEAFLLMAFVLLAAQIPGDSLLIRDAAAALPASPQRDLILALLIAGFGMKAGLVPFHFWMPLAYSAAPTPAAAVLSGAVVKASILGMIRFLPLEIALPDWGTALAAAGLFAALYGVVIGITQRNPRVVLAYSSVSQMGFIIAIIGMGMLTGDGRAALGAAFYAAHHVLVKGALFLSVGVIAATGRRRLWPMLLPTAIIAVGLGGLPLTGGALAKFVADELLGDSTASTIATLSAIGTTLLMLQFLRHLANTASQDPQAAAAAGLVWPWLATAVVSLVVPWTLYLTVPRGTLPDPLSAAVLWKALWPVLLGGALAMALWRWWRSLPQVPKGDIIVALDGGVRLAVTWGKALERTDGVLRQWPTATVSLLILTVALGAAALTRWNGTP